jgi:hypothetical protein
MLGLYSVIALWACDLLPKTTTPEAAAWHRKKTLTFIDAIGVRLAVGSGIFTGYPRTPKTCAKIPPKPLTRMAEALCFAV